MRAALKAVICFFKGHPIYSLVWLSERCEKVRCRRCDRLFAVNHEMQAMLPWGPEFEEFYDKWRTLG